MAASASVAPFARINLALSDGKRLRRWSARRTASMPFSRFQARQVATSRGRAPASAKLAPALPTRLRPAVLRDCSAIVEIIVAP